MKKNSIKWKKVLVATLATITIIFIILLAILSPVAKYVVQKYDKEILGRKIRVGWIYINPFTGYVHISNLKVFETDGDTLFFSCKGVSANFAMLKMLKKTYEIESITLNEPWGRVIQNRDTFNFNDFIVRWSPKDTLHKSNSEPVHFNILKIALKNGEFHYEERSIPVNYYIKNVNIESPGRWWNVDSMEYEVALKSGPSVGELKGHFSLVFHTLNYHLSLKVNHYELQFLGQYLRDITRYGSFTANLDADLKSSGNFGHRLALATGGNLALNDFHFGKAVGEDYAAFDKLVLAINDVDPKNYKYDLDTLALVHPFFKYERYDHLDNLQNMFGEGGSNYAAVKADATKFNLLIVIANFFEDLAKNFVKSYYRANKVAVYNADFKFNDFSLREKFGVATSPLSLITDTLDKHNDRMKAWLRTSVKPYGNISANLSLDPNDIGYFDLDYSLQKVPLSMFNPYVISYTSFPLDKGTLDFNGKMVVENSDINSDNHLVIVDPRVSKRVKKKDTKWIPVPLILSVVREKGGGIDYEIPIKGNLKNPKFKFKDVVLDVLRNIFVKPPSTPYLVHVKQVEKQVERYLMLKWDMRQVDLSAPQQKFVNKMTAFLVKNPESVISVYPIEYTEKEKEHILLFEARKKYFLQTRRKPLHSFSEDDSIHVDKMSVKDSAFVHYLNKVVPDTMLFTIQEKCMVFLGQKVVDEKFRVMMLDRQTEFMSAIKNKDLQKQVKMHASESAVPYNGFSYYKIEYKGDLPNDLLKAYNEMNELNEEAPRDKFEKERKKTGGIVMDNEELITK